MLSDKDRELIGIGASIAAGCQPCANFHLRAAGIAGASGAEISRAVNDALRICRDAKEVMEGITASYSSSPCFDAPSRENSLLTELVSVSAACALNSVPDLEAHITAARKLGATEGQVLTAIKIAEAVKRTAQRKVQEATGPAETVTPGEPEKLCHPGEEDVSKQPVGTVREAGAGARDCGNGCGSKSQLVCQN